MTAKTVTVVHCWSAPRSRSTALMYSFEARGAGCVALDEPLYREWMIQRRESAQRPYAQQMINGTPPDDATPLEKMQWERELKSLDERIVEAASSLPAAQGGVIFCKHMAKHYFLYNFSSECKLPSDEISLVHKHLLLIRDPVAVLSSWNQDADVHGGAATADEVGIVPLLSIYSNVTSNGSFVATLDADELTKDPEDALSNVCADLQITYSESMTSWESGPHKCDGPWAKVRAE